MLTRLRHQLRSPRQFYSPVVNPYDPRVLRTVSEQATAILPHTEDLIIDDDTLIESLKQIARFYPEMRFPGPRDGKSRYFFENAMFSYGDAIPLFGMIRSRRPGRIIEVGCGYSSALLMDINDVFFAREIELTFIDPYPATLMSLLRGDDEYYRSRVTQRPLQEIPTDVFTKLQANDLLLLDSSHVSKVASDVNDYFFRILPALAPGVLVHVHDIFYPFEYPQAWVIDDGRSWNEAYLLRAFLQYNDRFKIVYFNDYMHRRFGNLLKAYLPVCAENGGGGIWLEKT